MINKLIIVFIRKNPGVFNIGDMSTAKMENPDPLRPKNVNSVYEFSFRKMTTNMLQTTWKNVENFPNSQLTEKSVAFAITFSARMINFYVTSKSNISRKVKKQLLDLPILFSQPKKVMMKVSKRII